MLLQIAKENKDCSVFATDAILATLMTSPRSAYSWDIIVQVSTMWWYFSVVVDLVEAGDLISWFALINDVPPTDCYYHT